MRELKSVLKQAITQRLKTGDFSASVIADLRQFRKQQLLIFIIVETILVIVIAFCVYLVTQKHADASVIKLLSGLIGIGAGGGVELARRIWKEWAQTDLLVALFPNLSASQVNDVVEKLVARL